ncbi:MAG: helix-turn-helix transcriptional regulator [Bacteroidetes bacterium]|nr:helix-turn-helix transcriptional regulator [Bacteroidota bacterium]
MTDEYLDYSIFQKVFEKFSRSGIDGLDVNDPMMVELDRLMEKNNQLFYITDVILLDILYISKRVSVMFGLEPDKVSPGFFLTTTHPDDQRRHHLIRAKLISIAQELYLQKGGTRIISTNVRTKYPEGRDANLLYQCFLFYSKIPYESTFLILVITDITGLKRIHKGFHFYMGEDYSYFRYPDEKLLMSGNIFSNTEFRIIELIEEGMSSKEIAEKLFRSIHTITTHRSNIIKKSRQSNITEVIHELKAQGLL